jgi:hypothetical protein
MVTALLSSRGSCLLLLRLGPIYQHFAVSHCFCSWAFDYGLAYLFLWKVGRFGSPLLQHLEFRSFFANPQSGLFRPLGHSGQGVPNGSGEYLVLPGSAEMTGRRSTDWDLQWILSSFCADSDDGVTGNPLLHLLWAIRFDSTNPDGLLGLAYYYSLASPGVIFP